MLQYRNGLYHVAAAIVACWGVLFTQLPPLDLRWLVPLLVLGNLLVSTYYFMAGIVLLEQAEGSLQALVVTPLRAGEYLWAKALSLGALALAENVLLVGLLLAGTGGPEFLLGIGAAGWLLLAAGTVAGGLLYVFAGFATVVRHPSINEFLLPSIVYTSVLTLPLIATLAQWDVWPLYLHPVQPALVLLRAALAPAETPAWQIAYGLLGSALSLWLAFRWARRAYDRFVVAGGAVSAAVAGRSGD